MAFPSREEAGRRLGHHLREEGVEADVAVGLPRGGVVVAAEIARILQCPLEVLVVRKIGHPMHREFAVGAIAEHGVQVLNEHSLGSDPRVRSELGEVIQEERDRLREYQQTFHHGHEPDFSGKSVALVDDGLATGLTTEAAVLALKKMGAKKILVTVPVASTSGAQRLRCIADEVIALIEDPDFDAVGSYYEVFSQTTSEEVSELLDTINGSPMAKAKG